jgi:hypothetical protein
VVNFISILFGGFSMKKFYSLLAIFFISLSIPCFSFMSGRALGGLIEDFLELDQEFIQKYQNDEYVRAVFDPNIEASGLDGYAECALDVKAPVCGNAPVCCESAEHEDESMKKIEKLQDIFRLICIEKYEQFASMQQGNLLERKKNALIIKKICSRLIAIVAAAKELTDKFENEVSAHYEQLIKDAFAHEIGNQSIAVRGNHVTVIDNIDNIGEKVACFFRQIEDADIRKKVASQPQFENLSKLQDFSKQIKKSIPALIKNGVLFYLGISQEKHKNELLLCLLLSLVEKGALGIATCIDKQLENNIAA